MEERNKAKDVFLKSQTNADHIKYKKLRNNTLKMQRADKSKWVTGMLGENGNNSKKIWRTVKTVSGDLKRATISKIITNGVSLTKKSEIVEELNNAFIEKIKDIKENLPMPETNLLSKLKNIKSPTDNVLQPLEISEAELNKIIKEMKKNTSCGPDSINAIVLGDIFPTIKRTLLHLVNLSLCSGTFPSIYKTTKIIPIVKIGKNPCFASSYRPISNTSTIGKIIERCVTGRMMSHIKEHMILNKNHHGGISKHSTTTCILQILDDTKNNLEKNKKTAIMAIDLSSAYDLVDHDILIEKSRLMSVGKTCTIWLKNFLSKRSQFVELDGTKSQTIQCGSEGVVQGGPSSGELFVIFLNSLPITQFQL